MYVPFARDVALCYLCLLCGLTADGVHCLQWFYLIADGVDYLCLQLCGPIAHDVGCRRLQLCGLIAHDVGCRRLQLCGPIAHDVGCRPSLAQPVWFALPHCRLLVYSHGI